MFSLRLQLLQWLGGLVVALCCAVLGGMSFVTSLDDYRRVTAGVENFDRFRKVLLAVSAISAERGPANLNMTVAPGDRGAVDWLIRGRAASDSALDAAVEAVEHDGPEAGAVIAALAAARIRLAEGRAAVDAVVAQDGTRSPEGIASAILAMFAAADAAEAARAQASRMVVGRTPEINTEVFLSIAASALREQAGRFGSYVVMQLAAGSTKREMAFEEMFKTAGRLVTLRNSIDGLTASAPANSPVMAAMSVVKRRYFEDVLPRATAIAAAARAGDVMSVEDFTEFYVADLRSADALREAIAAACESKLALLREGALTRLVSAGALTLFVCLLLLGKALLFRWTLFNPLATVRQQVAALTSGDLSDRRQDGPIGPELREMLKALHSLRDEQLLRRELEERRRRASEELRQLAETDMLTGLLNRRGLEAQAMRILAASDARGQAVGLVMFDIDHFKRVNDTFGHGIGDVVLQQVAQELAPLLRDGEVFGRYGGEEFLLVLPGVAGDEAEEAAERLRRQVERMVFREAPQLRATASFGVAIREPGAGGTWEGLVAMADRRLYAAKRAGRNRICSSDEAPGWRWNVA